MKLSRAIAIASQLDRLSYYQLLDVGRETSSTEIERRYWELAPRLHPDRFVRRATREELEALTRISARLTEARGVLSVPARRARYDAGLAEGKLRLTADDDDRELPARRDPRAPVARKLLETARRLAEAGDRDQALAKLQLAAGFEPGSAAIASARAELEPGRAAIASARADLEPESRVEPPAPELEPESRVEPPAPEPAAARRYRRVPLAARVNLRLRDWGRFERMFTRDLSLGGVFLRTSKQLEPGSIIDLRFALPDDSSFELRGRVVRRVEPGGPSPAGVGVQFLEMPAATRRRIEGLLAAAAAPPPPDEPEAPLEGELTLADAVAELVRLRRCEAREVLGLDPGAELEPRAIEKAWAERNAAFAARMLAAADDPPLVGALAEIVAHLGYARDVLLEEVAPAPEPRESPPPEARQEPAGAAPALEIRGGEETGPGRVAPPLRPRSVLAPGSLADLGPRGVASSEDATLAVRIFELIGEGRHEAALELIAERVPDRAPPRLIAARHIARGYLARREGDLARARLEFESALLADRSTSEAIAALRALDDAP